MKRLPRYPKGSIGTAASTAYFGAGWSLTHVAVVSATSTGHRSAWLLLFALFTLVALAVSVTAIAANRRTGKVAVRMSPRPLLLMLVPLAMAEVISPIQGAGHIDADLLVILMILLQTITGLATLIFGRACIRGGIRYLVSRSRRAHGTPRSLTVCGEHYDGIPAGRFLNQDQWGRPPPRTALIA